MLVLFIISYLCLRGYISRCFISFIISCQIMPFNFSAGCTCERLVSFEFLLLLIADFIGEMFDFLFPFLLNFGVLLDLELDFGSVLQHLFGQSFPC